MGAISQGRRLHHGAPPKEVLLLELLLGEAMPPWLPKPERLFPAAAQEILPERSHPPQLYDVMTSLGHAWCTLGVI